ncbi:MAG: phosphoribulokinase [Eubacterium sp.]|nr:phosphoribulokinase [Eubacterium sp.]
MRIAIDGRCASGKSTLAEQLCQALPCTVFHMDDFFLRPEQRTAQRYAEPGGNIDHERFLSDVLEPLKTGSPFSYRPFDCHSMTLGEPVFVEPAEIIIAEGTYSCHPALWTHYDLHIFLSVSPEEQESRIRSRDPAQAEQFLKKWIPLEERYFAAYAEQAEYDLRFQT